MPYIDAGLLGDIAGAPSGGALRILVVRLDGIGDCILGSGFFIGLRSLFPSAHITALLRESSAPLFASSMLFDETVCTDALGQITSGALVAPYDLAICPRWDVDHWGARLRILDSGASVRVGFDRGAYAFDEALKGPPSLAWTATARTDPSRHEALKAHDLLRFLGASGPLATPRLFIPGEARASAAAFRLRFSLDRYAVLGVGAASPNRVWPRENIPALIDEIHSRFRLRCVVVGGEDAVLSARWLEGMRPGLVVSSAGRIDLMTSAALIASAALYVGADSGPMHLAATSGVPVVEISCHPRTGSLDHHNSPARFGPFGAAFRVVRPDRPLAPCQDGCDCFATSHCIAQIPTARVIDALRSLSAEVG